MLKNPEISVKNKFKMNIAKPLLYCNNTVLRIFLVRDQLFGKTVFLYYHTDYLS